MTVDDVKALYPEVAKDEAEYGHVSHESDYQPIIDSFGVVLVQVDDRNYEGDTRVIYEKDGRYGFLVFGWGSCSGCDALQACRSLQEIAELGDQLERSVKWFDTLADLQTYVADTERRELEFYSHASEWAEFTEKVAALTPPSDPVPPPHPTPA
jgi:hypothetical protein